MSIKIHPVSSSFALGIVIDRYKCDDCIVTHTVVDLALGWIVLSIGLT